MKRTFPVSNAIVKAVRYKKLSLSAQVLYIALCKLSHEYKNKDGWFYRSLSDLADDTGMNRNTVRRARDELGEFFVEVFINPDFKRGAATQFRLKGYKELETCINPWDVSVCRNNPAAVLNLGRKGTTIHTGKN